MNNENPFGRSIVCGVVLFAAVMGLLFAMGRGGGDIAFRAGYVAGNVGIPAIVTGFWAANSNKVWAWWRYGVTVFGLCVVFAVVRVVPKLAQAAQ